jgi:O-antigen/teichoic acid export membrane protein
VSLQELPSAESVPSTQESVSRQVLKNSLFNAAGFIWSTAVLVFLVTYILRRLGPELYGIWSLGLILNSYFGLFDFGFGSTLIKFIAEYKAREDVDGISRVITNAFFFYLVVDAVLVSTFFFVPAIVGFLSVPASLQEVAVFVGRVAIASFLTFNTFGNLFVGLFNGFQRMDVTNRINMAMGIPRVVGTIAAIESGYGLRGVVVNDLLVVILTILTMAVCAKKMFPGVSVHPSHASWLEFKKLFRFGGLLQVSVLSSLVNFHFDKLLLSKFIGLTSLTFYDLGARVVGKIRGFPLVIATSLLPAFSSLSVNKEMDRVRSAYIRSSKLMLAFLIPIFGGLFVIASVLIRLWLGDGYGLTILTLRVLSVAYCVNVFTSIASNVAQGMGYPQIESKAALVQTIVNIVLSSLLLFCVGFVGVLIGTSLALLLGALYYVTSVNRLLTIPLKSYAAEVLNRPLFYAVAGGGFVIVVLFAIERLGISNSLGGQVVGGGVTGSVFLGVYLFFLLRGGYFHADERAEFKAKYRQLWARRQP